MAGNLHFSKIGIIGHYRGATVTDTLIQVIDFLKTLGAHAVLEEYTSHLVPDAHLPIVSDEDLHKHCDLILVIGGDGSLLSAARIAVFQDLPVLGINRGRLGFLTDIKPDEFDRIKAVLSGEFLLEKRFLINAHLYNAEEELLTSQAAINDIVLQQGSIPHMIEFKVQINDQLVSEQRGDGIIVSTPTGSTAHALSGGGPILHPHLNAIVLVPIFPHTLSSRPIVVRGDSQIELHISENNESSPKVTCDGQSHQAVPPGGKVIIKKLPKELQLIHPTNYHYYDTLRVKLGWKG